MSQDLVIGNTFIKQKVGEGCLLFSLRKNVYFKTRLAEIVNASSDNDILVRAQKFLEEF